MQSSSLTISNSHFLYCTDMSACVRAYVMVLAFPLILDLLYSLFLSKAYIFLQFLTVIRSQQIY